MTLNKQSGNMFDWCTHTWNPIQGKCPHGCTYCYMRYGDQWRGAPEQLLKEEYLNDDLGKGRIIFVGSSTDMWAERVPATWVSRILQYCKKFPENTYAFLTKNPQRYNDFFFELPANVMLGITLETNEYQDDFTEAPEPMDRAWAFAKMPLPPVKTQKFVSIEPIMEFDLHRVEDDFICPLPELIKDIKPAFVSIGADSKKHHLPEPGSKKILKLIEILSEFTEVRIKPNMGRLLK